MPDVLSPAERAAIDDAVAKGKVTRVARGVTGWLETYYDEAHGVLKNYAGVPGAIALRDMWPRARKHRGQMKARREKVELLMDRGFRAEQIAEKLQVCRATAANDIHAIRERREYEKERTLALSSARSEVLGGG